MNISIRKQFLKRYKTRQCQASLEFDKKFTAEKNYIFLKQKLQFT
jgi:hypothetical protein